MLRSDIRLHLENATIFFKYDVRIIKLDYDSDLDSFLSPNLTSGFKSLRVHSSRFVAYSSVHTYPRKRYEHAEMLTVYALLRKINPRCRWLLACVAGAF